MAKSPQQRAHHWILDEDGGVHPCRDVKKWEAWFEQSWPLRLLHDSPVGPWVVTSLFLGLDYNHRPEGLPLLWETDVSGPAHTLGRTLRRHTTRPEALRYHWRLVNRLLLRQLPGPWVN